MPKKPERHTTVTVVSVEKAPPKAKTTKHPASTKRHPAQPLTPADRSYSELSTEQKWGILVYINFFIMRLKTKIKVRRQRGQLAGNSRMPADENDRKKTKGTLSIASFQATLRPDSVLSWTRGGGTSSGARTPQSGQYQMRLGMTRQLAFGPWDQQGERQGALSNSTDRLLEFFRSQSAVPITSLAFLIVFVICVVLFTMKEDEVEQKLKRKYGWGDSPNGGGNDAGNFSGDV